MPDRWSVRRSTWKALRGGAVYVAVVVIVLYPVLASPVIADDLYNPFGQFDIAGAGPGSAFAFGWDGAIEGASFRIVGNPVGALYNWMWLELAARFGISFITFFALTKLVVFVATAAAIAFCWRSMSALCSPRPINFIPAMCWVSVTLFGAAQIHAGWSNDPVADYPLAGYGAAALGFLVIGAAARFATRRTTRNAVIAIVAAVVSVTYYEMNVGAVIGATILLAAVAISDFRAGRRDLGHLGLAAAIPAVPAAIVVLGRFVTGDSAASYSGTTVRLDGAATTFARGVVSSMPGSAWRLSIDHLGGQLAMVFFVFGTVALVAVVMRWWFAEDPSAIDLPQIGDADRPGVLHPEPHGLTMVRPGLVPGGCALAVAVYAVFSLALQSITVKVQDEALGVGYVYTWYAMTSSAVALLVAVGARWVAGRPNGLFKTGVVVFSLCFLFVQSTVNWRLSEQLAVRHGVNSRLLDSYDDAVPVEQRCAALVEWTSVRWPDYYEDGIVDGLQESFTHFFDESFCPFGVGDG